MYMVQRYSMFIVINLLFNLFSSSVDMMGHVGGLIGGLLVATAFAVQIVKKHLISTSELWPR